MTTPRREDIAKAETEVSPISKVTIISLIRQAKGYRRAPGAYPNLDSKIDAVTELQAMQLNAALEYIDKLGIGEEEIDKDEDAVKWSKSLERASLVNYLMSVLFDAPTGYGAFGLQPTTTVKSRAGY